MATPNQSSNQNNQGNSPGGSAIGNKKQTQLPAADGPAVRSRNSGNGIKKSNSQNSQATGSGTFNENDTFNKHYNKELRVSKDEIPIVLAELNDSSIQFIKREQYEKALNLLQKAYGIMDVVDFNLCRRDKFHLFILFHNMALCYQKMQMLDECAQCIEQALEYLPLDQFNLSEKSISNRMKKLQILGKLKMQYCAILSQVHRHKDALDQAKEGVRISHLLINDMKQLAEFYVKREEIEQTFQLNHNKSNANISRNGNKNPTDQDFNYSSYYSNNQNSNKKANSSRNRSFSQFLSQQEAYQSEDFRSNKQPPSASFHKRQESFQQNNNLSSFYSVNYLEESMSYLERTAKKLIPILVQLKKKMIPEKNLKNANSNSVQTKTKLQSIESYNEDVNSDNEFDINTPNGQLNAQIDMKNILGYLNQGEWTQTLSIGSIMQLQPFTLKDMLEQGKNELELTRDSFIGKVSFLAVSYFCYSTEIRFILQMKEDPTYDPAIKQKESEYWHAKSLEIACTFLPGECPLLNHINLSYQKHFAPVKTTIMEEEPNNDDLIVVKPLNGIDNPKFQPIIRQVQNIQISITPYQMTPINQIAHEFLSQMISFNDYQEQLSQQQNSVGNTGQTMPPKFHQKSKSGDATKKAKTVITKKNQQSSYDELIDEDLVGDSNKIHGIVGQFEEQDELRKFEELFEKLMRENKIDKLDMLRKLKITQDGGLNNQMLEEGESSQFNDLLLDEQILGEESIDEEQIANEAIHHNSNSNNLYKFRNKENIRNDRPKTSHSIHRSNNNASSIGDAELLDSEKDKSLKYEHRASLVKQQLQQVEENKKKGQRPLSGGLQKIKNESQRSRINKMNQNFSMYEKFGGGANGNGLSPDKVQQYQSIKSQNSNNAYQHMQPPKSAQQNKSFDNNSKLNYLNSNSQITSTLNPKSNQVQLLVNEKKSAIQQQQQQPPTNNNAQAYDELKRRLLNEYKKLTSNKKTFDDQVRERYKNLKQRAVSGKKTGATQSSSNQQVSQNISANQIQATAGSQSFIATTGTGNLSPKHHLNVYKPTFIINNSFANESGNQSIGIGSTAKDVDVVDQISKKYRPQSKGSSIQNAQSQQILMSQSQASRQNQNATQFQDRQGSQYQNQPGNSSQQLMSMLINPEKKSSGIQSASKKNLKSHNLSQGQQDLNFVKQFLNDKGQPNQQQNKQSFTQNQNISPFPQSSNSMNMIPSQTQYQYQSSQQFGSGKPLIAQIETQMNKKQGNGAGQPIVAVVQGQQQNQKKHINQNQMSSQQQQQTVQPGSAGSSNQQQKLAAYEKLKKKLNYHVGNPQQK